MPSYIGDGQAWPSTLRGVKFPAPVRCWIFRRIGSRVPAGVIELVAEQGLRQPYGLQHGDAVSIEVFSSERVQRHQFDCSRGGNSGSAHFCLATNRKAA